MKTSWFKTMAAAAIAALTFGFAPSAMADEMQGVQLWEDGPEWATCNIGASSGTDFGYYFYWGSSVGYKMSKGSFTQSTGVFTVTEWSMSTGGTTETSPFDSSTCPTAGKTLEELYAAGYTDQDGKLTSAYDAAHAILGGDWRMPTQAEIEDLFKNCTFEYLRGGQEGRFNGRLVFTGKGAFSSVSITIPAAGIAGCDNFEKSVTDAIWPYERVCIWTCQTSSGTTKSARLYAKQGSSATSPVVTYPATDRFYGLPIRAIRKKGGPTVEVQPKPAVNTSVEGVYTNGIEIAKTAENKYIVDRDAEVDVVFNADSGYYFDDEGAFVTSKTVTKTASGDPTEVEGPAAVQVVKVEPMVEEHSTVGGVYVGGTEVKPVSDYYWVVTNATVDVVFNAEPGYYFLVGGDYVTSKTNTVTASYNPTKVQGPDPVRMVKVEPTAAKHSTLGSVYVGGTEIKPISGKYWVPYDVTVIAIFNADTGYRFKDGGDYTTSTTVEEKALTDPTVIDGPAPVKTYTITIDTGIQHGTVTPDKNVSAEDDTVTLTVTPEAGYELQEPSLRLFDADQPWLEVGLPTKVSEGVYTFTMQGLNILVRAAFEKAKTRTVEVTPVAGTGTTVSGVYTNGIEVVAGSTPGRYTVVSNAVVDVAYYAVAEAGYFFKNDTGYTSFATNTVTATNSQTIVVNPDPVQGSPSGGTTYFFLDETGAMTMVGSGEATGFPAEFDRNSVSNVVIGEGITGIGEDFFKGCESLTQVTGGKDLEDVGAEAFYSCPALEAITLDAAPDGMDAAVYKRTSFTSSGQWLEIPVVTMPGYKQVVHGKKALTDTEWTDLGSPTGKGLYDYEGYYFFKIDLISEE